MLFNSTQFLVFLPIVLLVASALTIRWRNSFLLVASYYFYGCWDWRFLVLLMATTVIDYWVGRKIGASEDPLTRRRVLLLSIIANLSVLGFFKYYNFFVSSAISLLESLGLHASAPALSIVLPVGVSFYTFQSMSYTIDVYRRKTEAVDNFWDFALYVAYFPQLVAGPISRKGDLLPQILRPGRITPDRINGALSLIVLGLAKKVLIADLLAPEVAQIFANPAEMSSGLLLKGAYFFTFQIYCDFSGYSDIARGVSELFGIRLIINFNQPYLSQSITEFWRRWHISLSSWLRDYLYITLGGNRHGARRTYRNLMLTMLIGGLWHGANWTFVVWGGLHGLFLAVERAMGIGETPVPAPTSAIGQGLGRLARTLLTFHVAVLLWIFFRASDVATAFHYVAGILAFRDLASVGLWPVAVAAIVLALDLPQYLSGEHTVFVRMPWWVRSPVYCGLSLAVLGRLLYGGRELPFIYFQF
jgi:D-alanyl-lipoteichoic acid acyltransferase DltB (MBOAT superfamily)